MNIWRHQILLVIILLLFPERDVRGEPSFGFIPESELPALQKFIPSLALCRQLIVVVTKDWEKVPGMLYRFERDGEGWQLHQAPWPVVVGRNGMGWGIGDHGGPPKNAERLKREGDGRAPAGIFRLDEAFGKVPAGISEITRFPYRQMLPTTRGVDDPRSRFYNRVINAAHVGEEDWQSAEIMLRKDNLYDWGIVVRHNWKPYPGYGSCIFLHIWRGPRVGTAGCTAMREKRMVSLARWLDSRLKPLLIQLPRNEYAKLEDQWQLPALK